MSIAITLSAEIQKVQSKKTKKKLSSDIQPKKKVEF